MGCKQKCDKPSEGLLTLHQPMGMVRSGNNSLFTSFLGRKWVGNSLLGCNFSLKSSLATFLVVFFSLPEKGGDSTKTLANSVYHPGTMYNRTKTNIILVGGFNQPLWKICPSNWKSFPQFSGWTLKKYLSCHYLVWTFSIKLTFYNWWRGPT